ncbi:MAG: hypothetical protein JW712_05700 [Dehalococcoidales bacterium]|nr:hypothetical protein [Dehalococcoidales bacterium]
MKSKLVTIALSSILVISAVITAGCTPELSPEEVIKKSLEVMNNLSSYRMELTGRQTENDETQEMQAFMEYIAPDRLHIDQSSPGKNESIVIGRTQYTLSEFSGYWNVREWPENTFNANYVDGFSELMTTLEEIEVHEVDAVDGAECFHYLAPVDMKARAEEQRKEIDTSDPNYEARIAALDMLPQWDMTVELWIDKEDYFLRQFRQEQEVTTLDDDVAVHQKISAVFRVYDFDGDFTIEPPPSNLIQGVHLTHTAVSSIGGDDIRYQKISYEISITNMGNETADDLKVFIDTLTTNHGQMTIEAEAGESPVSLDSEETAMFSAVWEYDLSKSSKEALSDLMKENVIRATYTKNGSGEREVVLSSGS